MTKFEEEFDKNVHVTSDMLTGRKICSANQAKALGHGWVSPEAHQARVNELIAAKEENIELLRKNATLKSQLQQQALPVVPECVAEFIEFAKTEHLNLFNRFDVVMTDEKVSAWLSDSKAYDSGERRDEILARAWLDGYQVEKPQLFYLKNKLTTSYLILDTSTGYFEHWGSTEATGRYKSSFTQQEIGSMETESYEQIEVAE